MDTTIRDLFGLQRLDVYDMKQLLPFINSIPALARKRMQNPLEFWRTILLTHFGEYQEDDLCS